MKGRVRIMAVPAGEAPQWVREKWVGLELPLTLRGALRRLLTGRSTRGRHFLFREEGCRVIDDASRR